MEALYAALRKLPASTDSWSCPWFRDIVVVGFFACIAGLLADTTFGYAIAFLAFALVLNVTVRRKRGIACTT